MSISIPLLLQTPDFGKILLSLRRRITYNLEAVAELIREISTHKLKSNLTFVITLSIPIPFVVQTPDFGKMLLKSRRRITHYLEVVAIVVL